MLSGNEDAPLEVEVLAELCLGRFRGFRSPVVFAGYQVDFLSTIHHTRIQCVTMRHDFPNIYMTIRASTRTGYIYCKEPPSKVAIHIGHLTHFELK